MNVWRFITIVLTALTLGMAVGHALEMPVRRGYAPALYVMVTHTLYFYFGTVGAMLEVGAVLSAVTLAAWMWRWTRLRSAVRWTIAGAACLVLAHALWWLLVFPMNQEFATWTPAGVPADWTRFRDQWEFTHTARAGIILIGLCALLGSLFSEIGSRSGEARVPEAEDAPVGHG
jgi:hypothetical protein